MTIEREVAYFSEETRIAGTLFLPDAASSDHPVPGVVLCHGFTGIKELILPDYARGFAEAGFGALAFDYRGFGGSDGPRGRLLWSRQVEDIRNSVTFLRTVPEVDPQRIGLWGTSYGAANVIVEAAADDRVRCVVAQVGFADGGRRAHERPSEEAAALKGAIEMERRKRVLTGEPTLVDPLLVLADPETGSFFSEARRRLPGLQELISIEFLEATLQHRPIAVVGSIAPRALLLVAAELDTLTPASESEALYAAAGEPRKLVILPGIRHYEIYSGEPLARSIREAVDWYRCHL